MMVSEIINSTGLGGYDKDFQERESPLSDSKRLSNQNGEKDMIQDNKDKSDSFSFHLVLLQLT